MASKKKQQSKLSTIDTRDSNKGAFIAISDGGYGGVKRMVASQSGTPFIRDEWSEGNWTTNRPNESVPWGQPEKIVELCMNTYFSVPIIHNTINLMTDFSVEGVKLQHPDKSVQSFLNGWWQQCGGNKILHDIFLDLFRAGNTIVRRFTAPIPKPLQADISRLSASVDQKEFDIKQLDFETREMPYKYITYNPTSLRVYGDEVVGSIAYYVVLDQNSIDAIYGYDRIKIGKDIQNKDLKRQGILYEYRLPNDKVVHIAWRKPSYMKYGWPFLGSMLEEVMLRRKMFVMLKAAADGWMSAIRIYKVGQQPGGPETLIMPNEAQMAKLATIIESHQPGASLDLIWNFAIELEEHYPPVEKVFSNVPLETIRKELKDGLGVPDVLIDGSGGNFANSFLAIKTLVERLEYARELVTSTFIAPELAAITESMGFRRPPRIKWGHMNLRDESTILKLLTALRDRKVISKESLLEEFDFDKMIEDSRLKTEDQQSDTDDTYKNYGPYFLNDQDLITEANAQMGGTQGPGGDKKPRGKPGGKAGKNTKKRVSKPDGINTASDNSVKKISIKTKK